MKYYFIILEDTEIALAAAGVDLIGGTLVFYNADAEKLAMYADGYWRLIHEIDKDTFDQASQVDTEGVH